MMVVKMSGSLLVALVCCTELYAQKSNGETLPGDFESLKELIDERWEDSAMVSICTSRWIEKAKAIEDYGRLAEGYNLKMHKAGTKRLAYADSAILAALRTNDPKTIGSAYLSRGIVYYNLKKRSLALDDYLTANRHIVATKDAYLIHKVKYQMAQTKYHLGYSHEALALFRECVSFFGQEDDRAHLNSLHGLGLAAQATENSEGCTNANLEGLRLCDEYGIADMKPHFLQSEAINLTGRGQYEQALPMLQKILPEFDGNLPERTVTKFYIGKCLWKLGRRKLALPYLMATDTAYTKYDYIRPDLRDTYSYLIDYAKATGDKDQQLHYGEKLRHADSTISVNFRYLSGNTFKGYDAGTLQRATEDAAGKKLRATIGIAMAALFALAVYGFWSFRKMKSYRRKFEALMSTPSGLPVASVEIREENAEWDISEELTASILKNLEKFERNKKYLEKDMGLVRIAALLNTNTKYASKVILRYRGKKTIEYVADLKIKYIVDCLREDKRMRRYTNKALADEAGFGSTQNFTKSFRDRLGFSPTYFISQLGKADSESRHDLPEVSEKVPQQ